MIATVHVQALSTQLPLQLRDCTCMQDEARSVSSLAASPEALAHLMLLFGFRALISVFTTVFALLLTAPALFWHWQPAAATAGE